MSAVAVGSAAVPGQRSRSSSGSAGVHPAGRQAGLAAPAGPLDADPGGAGARDGETAAGRDGAAEPGAAEPGAAEPGAAGNLDPGDAEAATAPAHRTVDPDQPLEASLLRAAVAGDPRARERLLGEIHPLVLRYCRARLGRQETVIGSADDVAQEVCLAVVNALPGYTLRGLSFRAFVYGIAAHKVTDAFRAIGRNRSEPMAEIPDAPVALDGPEYQLLQAELTERLGLLLGRLTPRQREVLVLRIALGLSAEETAQIVGSTPGAVRVTQHRALNRLRRRVTTPAPEQGDGDDELDGLDSGES